MRVWLLLSDCNLCDHRDTAGNVMNMGISMIPTMQEDTEAQFYKTGVTPYASPFIGIAATPYGIGLNYHTLLGNIEYIRSYGIPGTYLVEVEVPEEVITALRYDGDTGRMFTDDFLNMVRAYRGQGTALLANIPYIRTDWVASINELVSASDSIGTALYKFNPVQKCDENMPALNNYVYWDATNIPGRIQYPGGESNPEYGTFLGFQNIEEYAQMLTDTWGVNGGINVHTIQECMLESSLPARQQIMEKIVQRGVTEEQYPNITLEVLFAE